MAAPYCTSSSSKEKERQNPDRGHLGESQGSEWGSLTPPPTARGIRRARSCATPSLVRRGELACLPAAVLRHGAWGTALARPSGKKDRAVHVQQRASKVLRGWRERRRRGMSRSDQWERGGGGSCAVLARGTGVKWVDLILIFKGCDFSPPPQNSHCSSDQFSNFQARVRRHHTPLLFIY